MKRFIQLLPFDSQYHYAYDGSLREKELAARLRWFLSLRWIWAAGCLFVGLVATLPAAPSGLDHRLLLAIALFLALTNGLYVYLTKRSTQHQAIDIRWVRGLVVAQTATDYLALAATSYALGGIETPVIILYLVEISLVTLFCQRMVSLVLTFVGIVFAVLPLILEFAGVIPTLSVYGQPFKESLNADPLFLSGYLVGVSMVFLYCWYVVSEISGSLHQHEDRLHAAYGKLQQMDKEKTQAMLHAAHELKAPLAAIKSYVYTLNEGYCGELPGKAQQVVKRVGERSDLLMAKVVDIIHLSNLRTLVQPEMRLEELDLAALLEREIEEAQVSANERGIEIRNLAEQATTYPILGAEAYLHTLFSNLLHNAVNYSYDDGVVELAIEGQPDRVTVHIRDHGIGISKENQAKIFREHFRTNDAVSHNPHGTGLGLPMVKEIARIHDAELGVESEPGRGSRFSVTFPLADKARPATNEQNL